MKKNYFLLAVAGAIIISAIILRINQISSNEAEKLALNTELEEEVGQEVEIITVKKAKEYDLQSKDLEKNQSVKASVEAVIISPLPGDIVESPLEVKGRALGNWFFEAIIPIKLVSENNDLIVDYYAQAESEWMTEDFVSFSTTFEFSTEAKSGYLIVKKNKASSLEEYDDQISIPIKFK